MSEDVLAGVGVYTPAMGPGSPGTGMSLREVDPDDLTTTIFDYNDHSGTRNPGGVWTYLGLGGVFGLNAPNVSLDTSDRTGDGIPDPTWSYDDIVQSSFRFRAAASSYANLRTGIGTLQRLLSKDGVMRWVPNGDANGDPFTPGEIYYIYRKPSNIPALFSGNELETYNRLLRFDSPDGVAITINRERLLRGPTLLASVNRLRNSTMMFCTGTNSPDAFNWDSTTGLTFGGSFGANINWANRSFRFTIATTGTRNLQQATAAATAAPGDIWTYSFYVKASGGASCKTQAVIEFLDSGSSVLATHTGTLTTLSNGADFVRVSVTTAAAPASTDSIRSNVRFANGDATSYTVDLRRGQLEKAAAVSTYRVGPESVSNAVNASGPPKAVFLYNPGDGPALARLGATPSNASAAVALLMGGKAESSEVNLAEAVNPIGAANGWRTKFLVKDVTLYTGTSGDTSSQADGAATIVAAAKTTFTNQTSLVRRWRNVITPTDPEALHGRWQVYASVRPEVGSTTDTRYRVCLHWQAANRDPVANLEDEINLDATDATSSIYVPLLLGEVTFDANAGDTSLVLEGWAAQDAGTGSLWWDTVYMIPVDEQTAVLQVPGFRIGDQANETWLGSELTTQVAGAVSGVTVTGTKVVLNTVDQGVGTPPSSATTGGLIWAAGRHVVTALTDLRVPAGTAQTGIGRLRIRKAPGPGATVANFATTHVYSIGDFVKPTAGNLNSRTYRVTTAGTSAGSEPTWGTTDGGTTTSNTAVFTETTVASRQLITKKNYTSWRKPGGLVVAFDADGTTAYEAVVIAGSGITGVNGKIHVLKLDHTVLRVVDNTYSMQMLGDTETLQTVNGSISVDDLVAEGPFITLGAGLNALWLDLWSLAPLAYDDMDDRDRLAFENWLQNTTVSVDVIPRYW